jgi:hypothetical protein
MVVCFCIVYHCNCVYLIYAHSPLIDSVGIIFHTLLPFNNNLSATTKNFREDQKLGEGGFGSVYKGILQDINETNFIG